MKNCLLSLGVLTLLALQPGSVWGNLCDFALDAEKLQTSVFDTQTPSLVAFHRGEDEENPVTPQLMEASAASMGGLGFCVGHFDCSDPKNSKYCPFANFPTVALYLGEPMKNPYTKKNYREPLTYLPTDNSRDTSRKIDKFVAKALGADKITIVDSEEDAISVLSTEDVPPLPQAYLFTTKTQTNLLWRSIAYHFKGRLQVIQVKADSSWAEETNIIKNTFGEVQVPSLFVRASEKSPVIYNGDLKNFDGVVEWLSQFASPSAASSKRGEANTNDSDSSAKSSSKTKILTVSEFSAILTQKDADSVHIVAVRPSESSLGRDLDLSALNKKCYGAIQCAQFDCPVNEKLDESVSKFCWGDDKTIPSEPYLVVVPIRVSAKAHLLASPSKAIFLSQEGQFTPETIAEVTKTAQDYFPEEFAATVEESQIQNFLGACIQEEVFGLIVLSSSSRSAAPTMLRHLGLAHKFLMKVAYVQNPSALFLQQFGMQGASLPAAAALVPPPEGEQFQVMVYDQAHFGPMNFRSLTTFVYNVVEGVPGVKERYINKMKSRESDASHSNENVDLSSEPLVLTQITSDEQWLDACGPSFKGICAVGLVGAPDAATGTYDENIVSLFESVMKSLPHHMRASFRFVWLDVACQPKLAESFELTPDVAPSFVLYSPLKKRFATFIGSFKQDPMKAFASGMLNGKVPTFPIRGDAISYDDASDCSAGSGVTEAPEGEVDDFLEEIRREEEARAEAIRLELEEEKRLAEQREKEAAAEKAKKTKKKKKKKKSAKKEL